MPKLHIGVKQVNAEPMTRLEYSNLRGWLLPEDESGFDEGYLVECLDGGEPNLEGYTGCVSWSPKDVFDRAYRETDGMSFGLALEAAKAGNKIARRGWNGKGMFVIYVPGTPDIAVFNPGSPYAKALGDLPCTEILGHLDMYTVNSEGRRAMLPGWLASQTDMLSDDWEIIS